MALVVDVSAIVPLAFADEDHGYSMSVVREIAHSGGVVPALFWFEVWNVLATNEMRRGRLTQPQSELFLTLVGEMNLETAPMPEPNEVLRLSRSQSITAYAPPVSPPL